MNATPIYLDYNATTPLDPRVADAMRPFLDDHFGNPSSSHIYGQTTRAAVDLARQQVADLLGCTPAEILFTSGGTESNNTVIKGVAACRKDDGDHMVISAIEHPAIEEPCRYLEAQGFRITRLDVDETGRIDLDALDAALDERTILVSIMHANNEVGTLQPFPEIAERARRVGAWVHSDAAQSVGKVPVDVDAMGVDFLTVAGHKLYATKGVGALYLRAGRALPPLMHGAGHEGGRRAGTENVLQLVGLGKAAALAHKELAAEVPRLGALRDQLWHQLSQRLDDVQRHGHPEHCLPNTLHVGIKGLQASTLLALLSDDVAASAGSACHADQVSISPVLRAMGIDPAFAAGSLRLSVGRFTTEDEITQAANAIVDAVLRQRATP